MFGLDFSEIALIGVVALVLIGPKDLPVAIRAVSGVVKKLRRLSSEFQGHVDEMLRDADMGEVRSTLNELRGLDIRRQVTKLVDPDRTLAGALDNPFKNRPVLPVIPPNATAGGLMTGTVPPRAEPPAFVPPTTPAAEAPAQAEAPAFIPPTTMAPP